MCVCVCVCVCVCTCAQTRESSACVSYLVFGNPYMRAHTHIHTYIQIVSTRKECINIINKQENPIVVYASYFGLGNPLYWNISDQKGCEVSLIIHNRVYAYVFCVHADIFACMLVCACMNPCVCVYVCVITNPTHTNVRARVCAYVFCVHVYVRIYVHTCWCVHE